MEDAEESQCTTASVPNPNLKAKYDGKIVFLQLVNAVPIFSWYSEVSFEMLRSFPNLSTNTHLYSEEAGQAKAAV